MTTVLVSCLCGDNTEEIELPSTLPVHSTSCCCGICRYSTGVLYISTLPVTKMPTGLASRLSAYHSSTEVSRYFCSRCGSHMLVKNNQSEKWFINSGIVESLSPAYVGGLNTGLEELIQHEFVADTGDGGLAVCLSEHGGHRVSCFAAGPDQSPMTAAEVGRLRRSTEMRLSTEQDSTMIEEGSNLSATCQCGGVSFYITRPNDESVLLSAPWPDLLVPYHSSSAANVHDIKWWLRANRTKYLAGTCACRSCRLAAGYPIQAWAFVPRANIMLADGSPLHFKEEAMGQYQSSPGIFRHFCRNCGATAFWRCIARPELIDVSIGLLRASEGSRASSWLEWYTSRVSFSEDAVDKELIRAFEKGLERLPKISLS